MNRPEPAKGVTVQPPPPPWVGPTPSTDPGGGEAVKNPTSERPAARGSVSAATTVTVSSAASLPAAALDSVAVPLAVGRPKRFKRSLVVVLVALGVVVAAAAALAVAGRSSPAGVTAAVGDDANPPPDETAPTTPPSTAPPTTQALPPAATVSRVPTTNPVVFITIDDGWYTPPDGLAQLTSGTVPATTFLLGQVLEKNPELWKGLSTTAGSIENHSVSHPAFAKLSLQQQQDQICATSEDIAAKVGQFPTMFRPPYGSTNANTAEAAGRCGIKYVVKWGASVNQGKVTLASGDALRPGDILLLHYRPELAGDLAAALAAAKAAGLTPARLTDYLN